MKPKDDLVKVFADKNLDGFRDVLASWIEVLRSYSKTMYHEDNSWWYNERATLSSLAGAAWRLGRTWVALEEFSTAKRGVIPDKKVDPGRTVAGRCDLYVTNKSNGYAIEAKQAWQPIGVNARKRAIQIASTGAWKDAGNLHSDEAEYRLAAVFAIPYLPLSEVAKPKKSKGKLVVDEDQVRKRVEAWLGEFDLSGYHAGAYYFPRRCGEYKVNRGKSPDYVFPGVVLLLRIRKKAARRRLKMRTKS